MWNKIWPWLLGIALLAGVVSCNVALRKDLQKTRAANTVKRAPILLIEKSEGGSFYRIFLDGFGSETWWNDKIKLTIDATVPKDQPSALFGYNARNRKIGGVNPIKISFHDREDLRKYMGNNSMDIKVNSGRDSNVAISNSKSNANSCFIAVLIGD